MLNIKKLFAIVLLIAVVVTTLPVVPVSVNAATIPVALRVTSGTSVNEGGTVTVNVTYGNGAIINLTAGHVGLYGFEGNVSISGTGNTRTITVSNVTGSGSGKYITVNAGSAFLADGTLADGVKSAFFTINSVAPVDTEAPVLTIAGPNAAEVTEGGSVSYELTYTDNVGIVAYNLTAGHIGLYGFEGNVSISGEGNVRTVTISNVKNVGEGKYITVNAGTAVDADGNLANGVKSNPFTIKSARVRDTEAPVLTIAGPSAAEVKEGASVSYTLTYTDNVGIVAYNLTVGHIGLYGFTGDVVLSGEGNVRTVTINNVKNVGEGKYITVNAGTAMDADGNLANGVKSNPFKIVARDTNPPVLTIVGPSAAVVTEGESVSYILTYTDDVGIVAYNLTKGHIGLYGFTGDVVISGTGNVRTVTINNVKNVGEGKYITVNAGTAMDAEGNLANGVKSNPFKIVAKPSDIVEIEDDEAPVLKITGPSLGKISNGGSVVYTASYTDNIKVVSISLAAKNITLKGFTANVSVSGTGLVSRTITLTNIKGVEGSKDNYITISAGTAKDAKGNLANAATSDKFEILKQEQPKPEEPTPEKPTPEKPTPEKPQDWRPNPNTGIM